ncbi:MAG: YbcC family protein [Thiobacillaceae bacterium]
MATTLDAAELDRRIDAACARIAPLWPLKHFVAVNPFFGLIDHSFQDASDTLARITGSSLYMPRAYFREQLANGRITREDIEQAIARCGSGLDAAAVERALATEAPQPKMGMASVSELLDRVEGGIWSSFVTERISLHCAAYFDLGQAMVGMPWRDLSLYAAWRKAAAIDRSPAMMGLDDFRAAVARLPVEPRVAIAWAVAELGVPDAAVERYLHAALLSIGGWAAWARYLRWQAELTGQRDDSIVDLLAIRLMWDVLLFKEKSSAALVARWREMLAASMRPPSAKRQAAAEIDRILLNAMEIGFQRGVIAGLANPALSAPAERPAVQAAFCIDVRSEVFRRSLETVAPSVQTLGFAGFFGIFIEHVPLGASVGRTHVPVIFNPDYCIHDRVKGGDAATLLEQRRQRIGLAKAWKGFKLSASSCFSFVEAAGLAYVPKLLTDSFGWTRPVPDPNSQGLARQDIERIGPTLEVVPQAQYCTHHTDSGIPQDDRLDHAERILRAMAMTDNFGRLVLLVGHGSTTVNNPHATAFDCGACAGQTGEVSARVVAALMNDPAVRRGLRERGITIPEDTWFLAGLHDTTTDEVRLYDTDEVPKVLTQDLARLRQWLDQAGDLARMERATILGIGNLPDHRVEADVRKRSRDWSQVRPEWALANNAAFIAAPRSRTAGMELGGRAFLHEYVWQKDEGFKILELIMTAPMVVANWINMQYYGSVVDNRRFGSGNKVLHNIVGGAIGVLEGNGGDLRVGLPLQSLHDGKRWVHEPLRLSVFIEAPEAAIDDIIARHDLVRQLVENDWLHLFRIGDDGATYRRVASSSWEPA